MTSKYHHNEFISQIFNENMPPLLQKLSLKYLSEPTYSDFQDGHSFFLWVLHNHHQNHGWNLSQSHFSNKIMMFFWDYDVITMGIPHDFGRFRIVMCIPITKLNVTIPVLLKTSFKYRFHPFHPPYPPFLPPPPAPLSTTPSPNNLPPCQK